MDEQTEVDQMYSPTKQLYYMDGYLQTAECTVTLLEERANRMVSFELDSTIFYPEGGGQPSDQGDVSTETGSIKVERVRWQNQSIVHEGKMNGNVEAGQTAQASLKWNRRYKNMRVHSAGHLVHDVLMSMVSDLTPTKGNHGEKAFLEYRGNLDPATRDDLERRVNEAVSQDMPIRTWESTYDEVMRLCKFVMPNLPKHKKLRILRIGDFDAMPDGGVQVKSTREIGKVTIFHITNNNGTSVIRYGVGGPVE